MIIKRKYLITFFAILIFAVLFATGDMGRLREMFTYREKIENIEISDIDFAALADGLYRGTYDVIWVAADVEVTVSNRKVTGIRILRHLCNRGEKAEVITDSVIAVKSLQVDTIAGVTYSSMVILKAIENDVSN